MKEFLVNNSERFNTISDTKTNTVHLKYTTLLSMQEQSQDLILLLLQGLDCLILRSLWICWFRIISVFFEYLLRFYILFLQISLLGLQEVATLTSRLVFDLYLFMKVVKWYIRPLSVTANSSQLFKLLFMFPTSRFTFIYILACHSSHHRNVLFLIPRHDRPKEGGVSRLVYKLFRTWRWMATPREKKSNVKWKCEVVQNYSVTGNLEKVYQKLSAIFL